MLIGFLTGGEVNGFTLESSFLLLYLAFISAAAFSIWTVLLKYNSVGKVTVFRLHYSRVRYIAVSNDPA